MPDTTNAPADAGAPFPSPFPPAVSAVSTVQAAQPQPQPNLQPNLQPPPPYATVQSDAYFRGGKFRSDINRFKGCSQGTGFPALDAIQPLYPGAYFLGAVSSLGKTTFCQQMADQIAASGRYVLYFSLEQSDFELYSKSIARGFFRRNKYDTQMQGLPSPYPTPSGIAIRNGLADGLPELDEQVDYYVSRVQDRLIVVHDSFSMTVENIVGTIGKTAELLHAKPVVFIDYLQIIAPTLINGRIPDAKTSIDHIVHTLKTAQSKNDLTMVVISSLNRQNYLTPIDFESFKESGGIEYTADVMWGLQLAVLESPEFYNHMVTDKDGNEKFGHETNLKEKRQMIKDAKAANPRRIQLVCLKNRFGIANYTVAFDYYPANDCFWETYDSPQKFGHIPLL